MAHRGLSTALANVREALPKVIERTRALSLLRAPLLSDLDADIVRTVGNTTIACVSLWVSNGTTIRDLLDLSLA